MLHRRGFLAGVFSAFAAPAIVRVESIMPVRAIPLEPFPANVILTGMTGPNYAELVPIIRRAFIPRVFAQSYLDSPALKAMLDTAA